MLRDVIVHIANEQPILADLINEPVPSDVALICTNVRTMNGKKPVFIDKMDGLFVFPIVHLRFIEIPRTSVEAIAAEAKASALAAAALRLPAPGETAARSDEFAGDALARLAWVTGDANEAPTPAPEPEPVAAPVAPEEPAVPSDELDPDLLRRIREA